MDGLTQKDVLPLPASPQAAALAAHGNAHAARAFRYHARARETFCLHRRAHLQKYLLFCKPDSTLKNLRKVLKNFTPYGILEYIKKVKVRWESGKFC